MSKAIIVELTDTIPDSEQTKNVTITIDDESTPPRTYTGKISAIITYTPLPAVPTSQLTLEAVGLKSV